MAFNLTVEDSSPLISYAPSGAWTDSPDGDSLIQSYSGSSLHSTSAQGATATINFNGTGIWLYGGKRPNYGTYSITVDGQTTTNGNANNGDPAFKQLLGAASSLSNGPHTVVLTNTGSGSAVDLDSFIFQAQAGSGTTISNTTIDDTSPSINYAPSSSDWKINSKPNLNMNDTLHYTQTQGATATIPFSGDAVAVYGTVAPDHANMQISLDGQAKSVQGGADGFSRTLHTKTLLYYADSLGSQQHQLVLSLDPSSSQGQFMDIDAVTVFSSSSSDSGSNNASNPSTGEHSTNHTSRSQLMPIIIGAVAGAVALLLLIGGLLFFLHRRRQSKRGSYIDTPPTPNLPIQTDDMLRTGHRSEHFTDVRLSVNELPPGPPQVIAFPSVSRSNSVASYQSTTPMISKPPPPRLTLPKPPLATVSRFTPARNPSNGTASDLGPPFRPSRPPSLQITPQSQWNQPGYAL